MQGHRVRGMRTELRRARRLRRTVRDDSGFGLIEMMVSTTVGGVGLLALAGLQLATATQSRIAEWRTEQALAAQQVFEEINQKGFAAATSSAFNANVDGQAHRVTVTVLTTQPRVKRVTAVVAPIGAVSAQTFVTRIYDVRPVPAAPVP